MGEFDVKEFFKYACDKMLIIFVCMFIGFAFSIVYTIGVQKPKYESHTSIVLTRSGENTGAITQNEITLNENLVTTYSEIIKSRLILSQVIENLNLDYSTSELSDMITVSNVNNTELINISVSTINNVLSQDIANEIASVFKEEITSLYNIENVNVVDKAIAASTPYNVQPIKQMFIGLFGGLVVGFIIVFMLYISDDSIKKKEDVEKELDLNVLGSIPKNHNENNDLVLNDNPKSGVSEAFRTLTTSIKFLSSDKKKKTFLITSSMPSEGKSFVASNLAVALAQTGLKVLLIDGDIRKGRQHIIFGKLGCKGLTDLIIDNTDKNNFNEYIQNYAKILEQKNKEKEKNKNLPDTTKVQQQEEGSLKTKNLSIIFKGSEISSPTELLGSETNKKLFDSLKKKFDIIIIDSAPVNEGLSDSMLLSKLVDSVIIVGAFKSTSYKDLKATKEQLKNIKANILGIVLNKTVPKSSKYYGGYYGRNH